MMGLLALLKSRFLAYGGIILAVLASVMAIYAKGRAAERSKQRVAEVKEYHKTKEQLQKVKKENSKKNITEVRKDIQDRLKRLKS